MVNINADEHPGLHRYILANVKKHVVWDLAEDVDIELVEISDSFALSCSHGG